MTTTTNSFFISLLVCLLFCSLHLSSFEAVGAKSVREMLSQKKSMLKDIKDIQTFVLTMMDSVKTYALPSEQLTADQYYQTQQSRLEKTKPILQQLSFEINILEKRCNATVGENCNYTIPASCTAGWFGSDCSIPICSGYLPGDSNVCNGRGSCVSPNKCLCNAGWTGNDCEITGKVLLNIIGDNVVGRKWSNGEMASSCNGYKNPSTLTPGYSYKYEGEIGDGVYWIKTATPFKVWCDMSSNGGGWTLVVAQYENDPIVSWAAGLSSSYDPTLSTKKSFVVDSNLIPLHTFTGFGKDLTANTIDYFAFTYTTGDIANTEVTGLNTNAKYRIHRNVNDYYANHQPYNTAVYSGGTWRNTLTCTKSTGYNWSFSPYATTASNRGYAMGGTNLELSSELYAWTVWVK